MSSKDGKMKRLLVPRLRFPEFREAGEWQSPFLGDISEPVEERVGDQQLTPISISAGIGFVPQYQKFGRDISGNQYRLYTVVRDGDFVYNKGNSIRYPQGCVYDLQGWGKVAAPNVFICFRMKDGFENSFFRQCFEKNAHGIQLRKHITSGARSNGLLNISKEDFYAIRIPVPEHAEQQKIADCLSSLDELISLEAQKLEALKRHKKGLMQQLFPREGETLPRLRFPEFREAGEWEDVSLSNITKTITPNKKLQTSQYMLNGSYPIIDQSQLPVAGWTDDVESVITRPLPLIIFGDHTCVLKLATQPFAQGADGIKIISVASSMITEYIFQYLLACPIVMKEYKRHFSDLIKRKVYYPKDFKEQQKIADCLSSLDELIAAEAKKLDTLKSHKKGLIQQIFPVLEDQE